MGKDEKELESTSGKSGGFGTQVVLNVYDLTPLNHYTYWFGFGIFHSGIEGYLLFLPYFSALLQYCLTAWLIDLYLYVKLSLGNANFEVYLCYLIFSY